MSGLGVVVAGVIVTAIAGTIFAGVSALVIPAITLLLSGTTVLAALITLGTAIAALIAAMMGISDVLEGLQDVYNGAANNGEKGINLIRDTLFAENPDDYYMIEFMATMGASEGARTINQFGLDQQIYNNYQAMQEEEIFPDMAHGENPKVVTSNGLVKEGLGKISGKEYTVTQKGIDNIKKYMTEQGFIQDYENQAMIERLEDALAKGQKITGADAVFYTHELKEAQLVASGMEQIEAHEAALQYYEVSPFSVYHPDVIRMEPGWWNKAWFDFWGIERLND